MTDLVLPAPAPVVAAVEGGGGFPVRRIFCVGRNYGAHVREMGNAEGAPPIFFTKPADALVDADPAADARIPYASATQNLHHEIELVIALRAGGTDIAPGEALACVFGYAAGVDLTRRDLQRAAGQAGQPWDASKAFDHSAPISPIRRMEGTAPPADAAIRLSVAGAPRQSAKLSDMIWGVADIVAEASRLWALKAGDLIFTGTPDGVGPIERGERVEGEIEGVGRLAFTIV